MSLFLPNVNNSLISHFLSMNGPLCDFKNIYLNRLDAGGHLRLTDFGLAKSGVTGPGAEGGTKTFCGTPEYLAPEILENKGHGKAVDWWALGTLLYEMLTGLPPFYDTNVQRMYHKILHDPLKFPRSEK